MTAPIPDELLLAALSASTGKTLTDLYDLIEVDVDDHDAMERALRAVLPLHEHMVREQAARKIEAAADALDPRHVQTIATFHRAARIARGETQ